MDDTRGVTNRLLFAKRRLDELTKLGGVNSGTLLQAETQQRIQEFFFHLVGAIDFLAQAINDDRKLIVDEKGEVNEGKVTVAAVCQELKKLQDGDSIRTILNQLHPKTRGEPLPQDPYSEEGSLFRIILFRNHVCHYGRNPFCHRRTLGGRQEEPLTSLVLDPRDRENRESSCKPAIEELTLFWQLVKTKCEQILSTYQGKAV